MLKFFFLNLLIRKYVIFLVPRTLMRTRYKNRPFNSFNNNSSGQIIFLIHSYLSFYFDFYFILFYFLFLLFIKVLQKL